MFVLIGGVQLNQMCQVVVVVVYFGMKCVFVQEYWVNYEDLVYDWVGNIQLLWMMGVDVWFVVDGFDIGICCSWEEVMESV